MPSAKKKSSKPTHCPACGGVDLIRKITTYPVLLSGPLEGKQVHVGRVASQCQDGHPLVPRTNSIDRLPPLFHAPTRLPQTLKGTRRP
jgi:hypothetical protein